MVFQMKDRGSHQEPAYHDHKEESEVAFPLWPPNQGYDPRGTSRKIKSRWNMMSHHESLLPGEWYYGLSGYQASIMASILTMHNTS